ncbi:MAG: alpha/beta hydrolase [Thermoanaerobaculia bacterium]
MKTVPERRTHTVAHRRARTEDGIPIVFTWWRRPSREVIVIAPGFWRVRLARENLYLANHFLRRGYDVAVLDFRGHGDSGGRYTFGAFEALDLKALADAIVGTEDGYSRFSVLGLSLGGSIAAGMLARWPDLPARALAMISSPARLTTLRPRPWKPGALRQVRLRHALRMPRLAGRQVFKDGLHAADAVSRITIPKLIVTSEGDWLVDPSHGRLLAEAAAPPVDYVHLDLPGSLHADALVKFVPLRLLRLLDGWFARNAPP